MKKIDIKQELINRYKYIYKNVLYILLPYVEQEVLKEKKLFGGYQGVKHNQNSKRELYTYLIDLPYDILLDLESFLLSDIPFESSKLYFDLETKKQDLCFLNKIKDRLHLLEMDDSSSSRIKLDSWKVFLLVRQFIDGQTTDVKNKEKKLTALDEYFRINRYKNDGKIWVSGYEMYLKDLKNYSTFEGSTGKKITYKRNKDDSGLKNGYFINYLANRYNHYQSNLSILTEEEKQEIYLTFHDVLPWNLEVKCESDETLTRPEYTKPCHESFNLIEKDIFVDFNASVPQYYQLCPHCGFMVNVSDAILSDNIKNRIISRCKKRELLFLKRSLLSEYISLDKLEPDDEKIVLSHRY